MPVAWVYTHQDLGESVHADGSPILRPIVPLVIRVGVPAVLGVLDSGSPISVANADLFARLGVDIEVDEAVYLDAKGSHARRTATTNRGEFHAIAAIGVATQG
jgi:hypothetical protein